MEEKRKSNGYWTKERCHEEALKYKTRTEFARSSTSQIISSEYNKAQREGWLDEICSHMDEVIKPPGYWTKERCREEALKYKSKVEFSNGSGSTYTTSRENGWLNEICGHMVRPKQHNLKWTKEKCQEEALKYNMRSKFLKYSRGAYRVAHEKGWLDEICDHMTPPKSKPPRYWTKERCIDDAKKYKNKTEWGKNSGGYGAARHKGWIDECCGHMETLGSLKMRHIYSYEFPKTKHVYVGLTWDINERMWSHDNKTNSQVFQHMIKYKLTKADYIFKTHGYYNEELSILKEGEILKKYTNDGWVKLNKAKHGALGGNVIKWTKEKCHEEALKYNMRSKFKSNSASAYCRACKEGWLDDICSHMISKRKPLGYWTKERCYEESLKCESKNELKKRPNGAYNSSFIHGWLDEFYPNIK